MISLSTSQEVVNQTLASFLSEQKAAALAIHPSYARLYQEIERVVFAGGKRLRPHLVFIGYSSYDDRIAKIAAAHELLHVALLIHDDIIDRDTFRHGQATIHHNYDIAHYAPFIDNEHERHHFSTSAALLAGDLLISSAYELVRQAELSTEQNQAATRYMSTGIFEVAGGELLDTEAPFTPEAYDPITVYRYKTTGYSFISPLLTGAMLSGKVDEAGIEKLRDYATSLGIAYQIKDDYLGVFGDTATTGKSTTSDLREGKQTILIAKFKELATDEQLKLYATTFGQPHATEADLQALKAALYDSGALADATRLGEAFTNKAVDALNKLEDAALRKNLSDLILFLNERLS